jgi:hypothetical protein
MEGFLIPGVRCFCVTPVFVYVAKVNVSSCIAVGGGGDLNPKICAPAGDDTPAWLTLVGASQPRGST